MPCVLSYEINTSTKTDCIKGFKFMVEPNIWD